MRIYMVEKFYCMQSYKRLLEHKVPVCVERNARIRAWSLIVKAGKKFLIFGAFIF